MASDLLVAARLTWADVIGPVHALAPCAACHAQREDWTTGPWRIVCARCANNPDLMTDWEVQFVGSLLGRSTLTPRQEQVLRRIARRLREAGR